MPRAARGRGARRAGAALFAAWLIAAPVGLAAQTRQVVRVGQVTAIAEAQDLDLAVALAERADRPHTWYGLGRREVGPVAIVVVKGRDGFDAVARGRLPAWGAGLALPSARLIAIRRDAGDPFRILRHELAHLALHSAIRGRVPRWFDEGYAAVASGEFDRLAALELNLAIALRRIPTLAELDAGLRGTAATASAAYALAATGVLYLADRHPTDSLSPLLEQLARGVPFDSAIVLTTGLTADRFEEAWRQHVRRRHSIGPWLVAGGMWAVAAAAVVVVWHLRRRRDAPRRAALDDGWTVPVDAMEESEMQSETNRSSSP